MNRLADKKISESTWAAGCKIMACFVGVASAVIMPQLFHFVGQLFSLGSLPGEVYLPMHLPVILVGLIAGPFAGLVVGIVSPAVSFEMSGMPSAVMLPVMCFELAGYGLASGLLSGIKINSLLKIIIAQFSGRLVRAVYILASVYIFGSGALNIGMILGSIVKGFPGIVIQWLVLPLLCRIKGEFVFKYDE